MACDMTCNWPAMNATGGQRDKDVPENNVDFGGRSGIKESLFGGYY